KTTLLLRLCAAVVSGTPFLDRPTRQSGVVYLSEERSMTLKPALERAGLLQSQDLHLLLHGETDWPFPDAIARATDKAHRVGARLLVVDTFPDWARLQG